MTENLTIMATRPSAGKLVSKDVAFLFLILGLVTPVLLSVVLIVINQNESGEEDGTREIMTIAVVLAATIDAGFGIGFYLYRWKYFSNFLTTAAEAPGEVSYVSPPSQERLLEYKYSYLGRDYDVRNKYGSLSSKRSRLVKGDRVTVLLNPEKPSESLILDLYV